MRLLLTAALLITLPLPSLAADWRRGDRIDVASIAQVIDGDTLRVLIKGETVNIRLHGIDAPEHNQACGALACGTLATNHLVQLVNGTPEACRSARMHGVCLRSSRPVKCTVTDVDNTPGRPVRPVAICVSGQVDLNERMVADGYAFAYEKFSRDYVPLFVFARKNQRGLHGMGALQDRDSPAAFRRSR
jgi:endonuclease YncB( thermonuclease family)